MPEVLKQNGYGASVLVDLWPSWVPGAPGTAPARNIIQVSPKINSGDQL